MQLKFSKIPMKRSEIGTILHSAYISLWRTGSSIKTENLLQITPLIINFNSTLVRLKPSGLRGARFLFWDFNSTLVRLKPPKKHPFYIIFKVFLPPSVVNPK